MGKYDLSDGLKYNIRFVIEEIEKLLREGYGQDAINYAMSNITFTDNSQERLIKEYEKLQDKNIEKEKIIARLLAKGYECSDIKRILK